MLNVLKPALICSRKVSISPGLWKSSIALFESVAFLENPVESSGRQVPDLGHNQIEKHLSTSPYCTRGKYTSYSTECLKVGKNRVQCPRVWDAQ